VAKQIAEEFHLIQTNQRHGISFSLREILLGQPDPPAPRRWMTSMPSGQGD
jgi:hypothetical protein